LGPSPGGLFPPPFPLARIPYNGKNTALPFRFSGRPPSFLHKAECPAPLVILPRPFLISPSSLRCIACACRMPNVPGCIVAAKQLPHREQLQFFFGGLGRSLDFGPFPLRQAASVLFFPRAMTFLPLLTLTPFLEASHLPIAARGLPLFPKETRGIH